ncbi:PQQ-binding-like beta-propeller repeat protein [Halorubellus litoreus]|uniref:PQQ-binding-like beta-propeller repeat protein n=1 Tax=Halorubellus litoreus TaxID=755308 RepID=A0ABD5VCF4_9EURY
MDGNLLAPVHDGSTLYISVPTLPTSHSEEELKPTFIALEWPSGTQKWTQTVDNEYPYQPIVDENSLYTLGYNATITVLDTGSGEITDSIDLGYGWLDRGIHHGERLLGSADSQIYALSTESHTLDWEFESDREFVGGPAASGNTLVFATQYGGLIAIDTEDGSLTWKRSSIMGSRTSLSSPMIHDGSIFISSGSQLGSFSLTDGSTNWTIPLGGDTTLSPTLTDQGIVVCTDNQVYCHAGDSGERKWESELPGQPMSSGVGTPGAVFIPTKRNRIYKLDTQSGGVDDFIEAEAGADFYSLSVLGDHLFYSEKSTGIIYHT